MVTLHFNVHGESPVDPLPDAERADPVSTIQNARRKFRIISTSKVPLMG